MICGVKNHQTLKYPSDAPTNFRDFRGIDFRQIQHKIKTKILSVLISGLDSEVLKT